MPEVAKHVFVSYVREDTERVDKLCRVLEAAGVPYWRDRNALGPGEEWKRKVRKAIQSEAMVFLACFSDQSRAKDKSYMNEELTLAVEESRKRPPGRPWLIPIRFDTGDVPDWDLGAGRTLDDLNYVDLFGDAYTQNAVQLVQAIEAVIGVPGVEPTTVGAAVAQAAQSDPPALEIIKGVGAHIDSVGYIMSRQLAHEIWARRLPDHRPQKFDWRQTAVKLVEHGAAGEDLHAERLLVPDNPLSDTSIRFRVGIEHVMLRADVLVRNRGSESAGIRLRSASEQQRLDTDALAEMGAWLTCAVSVQGQDPQVVVASHPARIPVQLKLGLNLHESRHGDPIALARACRAFATALRGPIAGIKIVGVSDSGEESATDLTIRIVDEQQQLAVNDLSVDDLEPHVLAIDKVVSDRYLPELLRNQARIYDRWKAEQAGSDSNEAREF